MTRTIAVCALFAWGCGGSTAGTSDPTDDTDHAEAPPAASGLAADDQEMLDAHNAARAEKGVPPLAWDEDLVEVADAWSAFLARDGCYLEHDGSSSYGENLYWSSYASRPQDVVDSWVSEERDYNYARNTCAPNRACGHYTQVVWADTTHVGCKMNRCRRGEEIWMCVYDPAGNWVGERPY
jgi:pathogenesis-related protein 1